jgi:hypothetical protein
LSPYGTEFLYGSVASMMGHNLLGKRVYDVLVTIEFLKSHGWQKFSLVGSGIGSIISLLVASISDDVNSLTLNKMLSSYESLFTSQYHRFPMSACLPEVLKYFDLPQIINYVQTSKSVEVLSTLELKEFD